MIDISLTKKEFFSFCKEKKFVNTKIQLKVIYLRWLLRGKKSFLDFVPILEQFRKDSLFQTDFIKSLTHEYWMQFLKRIILRTFVPWLCYSTISVVYFTYTLDKRNKYSE